MEELIKAMDRVEELYRKNKMKLILTKLFIILIVFIVMIMNMGREARKHIVDFKPDSLLAVFIILFIGVMVPLIVNPLINFFSDALNRSIFHDIKSSIFRTILTKFDARYNESDYDQLPKKDVKNLDLWKHVFRFYSTDDLLIGTMNAIRFRFFELHVFRPFMREFDGIVGVLIFPDRAQAAVQLMNHSEQLPDFVETRLKDEIVYLFLKGRKSHFELKIKKGGKLNREKLISDYVLMQELCKAMYLLTLR
jgi:hypothetical protein